MLVDFSLIIVFGDRRTFEIRVISRFFEKLKFVVKKPQFEKCQSNTERTVEMIPL